MRDDRRLGSSCAASSNLRRCPGTARSPTASPTALLDEQPRAARSRSRSRTAGGLVDQVRPADHVGPEVRPVAHAPHLGVPDETIATFLWPSHPSRDRFTRQAGDGIVNCEQRGAVQPSSTERRRSDAHPAMADRASCSVTGAGYGAGMSSNRVPPSPGPRRLPRRRALAHQTALGGSAGRRAYGASWRSAMAYPIRSAGCWRRAGSTSGVPDFLEPTLRKFLPTRCT